MSGRILVPLDGTPRTAVALPVACALAQANRSQIVLFSVVDTTAKRYDAKNYLEGLAGDYASSTVPVTSEVWIASDMAAQIPWAVAELRADVVVMATSDGVRVVYDSPPPQGRMQPMTTTVAEPGSARCFAELPSGEILVPGVTSQCSGPDAFGCCDRTVAERPCAGATWHYPGSAGWSFVFRAEADVCPVSLLDPLGPLPVPQD